LHFDSIPIISETSQDISLSERLSSKVACSTGAVGLLRILHYIVVIVPVTSSSLFHSG